MFGLDSKPLSCVLLNNIITLKNLLKFENIPNYRTINNSNNGFVQFMSDTTRRLIRTIRVFENIDVSLMYSTLNLRYYL